MIPPPRGRVYPKNAHLRVESDVRRRGAVKITRFALFGALMLLTGCMSHYRNSLHPEYGQTEFDADWYECQQDNSPDFNVARACLAARGSPPVPDPHEKYTGRRIAAALPTTYP